MQVVEAGRVLPIRLEVVDIWEQFYRDEDSKDVELRCRDGSAWAHSVFLERLSEPLRCMLRSGMQESRTRKIDLPDFTSVELRFTLRLCYTGHMDAVDWEELEMLDLEEDKQDDASFGCSRNGDVDAEGRPMCPPTAQTALTNRTEIAAPAASSSSTAHSTSAVEVEGPLPYIQEGMVPSRNSPFVSRPPPTCNLVPPGVALCAAPNKPVMTPPIGLLFGCASFAKKYEVPGFLNMMIEKIKPRLAVDNFDDMMKFAVAIDVLPLRVHCAKYAEGSDQVRQMLMGGKLSAEVEFELQGLLGFPTPPRKHDPKHRVF